eukprot:GHVU01161318.1.p1 GENE.GHVU01161318.1~~GHVU01161318.1.p1  ORF type:complete len:227 (-),score=22.44 GHVU01161318.1:564-1244(-)
MANCDRQLKCRTVPHVAIGCGNHIPERSPVALLDGLCAFVADQRDRFDHFEKAGINFTGTEIYASLSKRACTRSAGWTSEDATSGDEEAAGRNDFRIGTFIATIDQIVASLGHRRSAYDTVATRFGFLKNICSMDADDVRSAGDTLRQFYAEDFDEDFPNELVHFKLFADVLAARLKEQDKNNNKRGKEKKKGEKKEFRVSTFQPHHGQRCGGNVSPNNNCPQDLP